MGADGVLKLSRYETGYKKQIGETRDYLYTMEDSGTFRLIFAQGDAMFEALVGFQKFLINEAENEHPISESKATTIAKMRMLEANLKIVGECLHVMVTFEPPLVRKELNECVSSAGDEIQPWL
jgi:hypothetical protein